MEEIKGHLYTVDTLCSDLMALGVQSGKTILVHSSFKALGQWVCGGPAAVVLALEGAVGDTGTIVMPTQSGDLSDPSGWSNPPVPIEWWETIREQMPPYDPELTLPRMMGIIPETFRKQHDTIRSGHPLVSFAARGLHAKEMITGHSLDDGLGEYSPLGRIYSLEGDVLLLGVGHGNNTSLHLAEYRASYPAKKRVLNKAPMLVNGSKRWVEISDIEYDTEDFERLGADFERDTRLVRRGKVGGADAMLMPQRELVDYAVKWMEHNRK